MLPRRKPFRLVRSCQLLAGYQMGKKAKPLFGVNWEANWGRSVDEIRLALGILDNAVLGEGVLRPAS